jgi:hypothetical protein
MEYLGLFPVVATLPLERPRSEPKEFLVGEDSSSLLIRLQEKKVAIQSPLLSLNC